MKKKVLSLVLTAAMMTTMLAGCGSSDNGSTAASTGEAPAADRKSTRLNSSHNRESRMPSSA